MADREGHTLTVAQRNCLERAAFRSSKAICPIIGVHAAAQTALIGALNRRGLIEWDGPIPRISSAGITAIAKATKP